MSVYLSACVVRAVLSNRIGAVDYVALFTVKNLTFFLACLDPDYVLLGGYFW